MQVRQLSDSAGDTSEAGPSIAVQMIGLNAVPVAGDEFCVCESEQQARQTPLERRAYLHMLPSCQSVSVVHVLASSARKSGYGVFVHVFLESSLSLSLAQKVMRRYMSLPAGMH